MKPFAFNKAISPRELGDACEFLALDIMQGIARNLQLSDAEAHANLPDKVDIKVIVVDACEFMTNGSAGEDIDALKIELEKMVVFEEINRTHAEQGGKGKRIKKSERLQLASELYTYGSAAVTTQGDTIFIITIKPNHIDTADAYLATLAGLKEKNTAACALDLQTLQNMHVLRQAGDQIYGIVMKWLEQVSGPALVDAVKGKERKARKATIDLLVDEEAEVTHRAMRFDEMIEAVCRFKGDAGVQQYIDALFFHGIAHGGEMGMLTGKLTNLPAIAMRRLRQAYGVHVAGLEGTDATVVKVAEFLSNVDGDDRKQLIGLFGKTAAILKKTGFTDDMAETLSGLKKKFAERGDVQKYIRALEAADKPDMLADYKDVVPFMFKFWQEESIRLSAHNDLTDALLKVFSGTAVDSTYESIQQMAAGIDPRVEIQVYTLALAQRYLETAQALMPKQFPALAPERGQAADQRLMQLKMLMNARPVPGQPGAMLS